MIKSEDSQKILLQNFLMVSKYLAIGFSVFFIVFKAFFSLLAPISFFVSLLYCERLLTKNKPLQASRFYVTSLLLAPTFCIFFSGGFWSPLLPWLAPTPFLASLLVSSRFSLKISSTAVSFLLFLFLSREHFYFLDEFPNSFDKELYSLIALTSSIIMISIYGHLAIQQKGEIQKLLYFPTMNPNPVFKTDNLGNILQSNPIADTILKIDENNSHKNIIDIFNSDTIKKDYFNEEGLRQIQVQLNNRSYIFSSVKPKDKEEIYYFGMEITNYQKLESDLQLSSKLASIGEISAGVGHEINNPLTVIFGYIKKLEKNLSPLSNDTQVLIEKFKSAAQRIKNIVDGLRTFSRRDKDNENFTLQSVIEQTLNLISEIYLKEGIKIQKELPAEPLYINGSFGKTQQVLFNLLTNAHDALEGRKKKEIIVSLKKIQNLLKNEACIEVTDSGQGMTKEIQEKIFETFFTTKPVGKGTGLGMGLIHKFVTENKGIIEVDSKENIGTTMRITFPTILVSHEELKAPDSVKDSDMNKEQTNSFTHLKNKIEILIVDDEIEIIETLKDDLIEYGAQCTGITSALEAIHCVQNKMFDIIITDMNMSEMSGRDFILKIKDYIDSSQTQIYISTGGLTDDLVNCKDILSNYISGTLIKPFEEDEIKALFKNKKAA